MSLIPEATSTPNIVPRVGGRKTIRRAERDSIQSPITPEKVHFYDTGSRSRSNEISGSPYNRSPSPNKREVSPNKYDCSDYDEEDEDDIDHEDNNPPLVKHRKYDNRNKEINFDSAYYSESKNAGNNGYLGCIFIALTVIGIAFALYFVKGEETIPKPKLEDMCILQKALFQNQDPYFCLNFEVALRDIIDFEKSRTIVLLYDNKSENTMDKILNEVIKFALCHIRSCDSNPVVIEGASLNVPEYKNDYGKILTDYRESLETNGLLIITNIEDIPGRSAQALHSLCDEYTPLVNRALIILTLKVEKLPYTDRAAFVRKTLLNLWNDIGKDDKFDPLISRIAGTVLTVAPE